MSTPKRLLLLVTSLLLVSASSFAGVITFDQLPGDGRMIPDGYAGLTWTNFGDINAELANLSKGDQKGMVSAPNVAFSIPGAPSATISSAATFSLGSGWFTSAVFSEQPLIISGLLNGVKVDSMNVMLNSSEPVHVVFNWSGINQVVFSLANAPIPSSASPLQSGGVGFVLDNLVINNSVRSAVPEPVSLLLLSSGVGMALTSWKRRRA
jgi:hypothetical protein